MAAATSGAGERLRPDRLERAAVETVLGEQDGGRGGDVAQVDERLRLHQAPGAAQLTGLGGHGQGVVEVVGVGAGLQHPPGHTGGVEGLLGAVLRGVVGHRAQLGAQHRVVDHPAHAASRAARKAVGAPAASVGSKLGQIRYSASAPASGRAAGSPTRSATTTSAPSASSSGRGRALPTTARTCSPRARSSRTTAVPVPPPAAVTTITPLPQR